LFRVSNFEFRISGQAENQKLKSLLDSGLSGLGIKEVIIMWYFAWILGVLLACAFGIINVMWMETEEMLGSEKDS